MAIKAYFPKDVDDITVGGLTQWDYGQTLEIYGLKLPALVEVHFANREMKEATVRIGETLNDVTTVFIPDGCLEHASETRAWVYIISNEGETGETVKTIHMPVVARTKPQGYDSRPIDQEQYNKALADISRIYDEVVNNMALLEIDTSEELEEMKKPFDDTKISKYQGWSSAKINDAIGKNITTLIDDKNEVKDKVWSSDHTDKMIDSKINTFKKKLTGNWPIIGERITVEKALKDSSGNDFEIEYLHRYDSEVAVSSADRLPESGIYIITVPVGLDSDDSELDGCLPTVVVLHTSGQKRRFHIMCGLDSSGTFCAIEGFIMTDGTIRVWKYTRTSSGFNRVRLSGVKFTYCEIGGAV